MLVKAVSGSAGLRIAGMSFGFLVGVQLARGLGAEDYGIYGLVMSLIALLTVPTTFGFPQLLTREVAQAQVECNWGRVRGVLAWSTRVSLSISAVLSVGVLTWIVLNGQLSSEFGSTMLAALALVPVVALLSLRSAALRGAQNIVKGQISEVALRPALHSMFLFLAFFVGVPLTPALAMWLGVLGTAMSLIVAHWLLQRTLPKETFTAAVETDSRGWWSSAVPMAMTEGMVVVQGHSLVLIIGIIGSVSDVGVYRVATSAALLIAVPFGIFNSIGAPNFARLHAEGRALQLQRMTSAMSLVMFVSAIALSFPFIFFGQHVIPLVFGEDYSRSHSILSILCGGLIVSSAFGPGATLLNMIGMQKLVTRATLWSLAFMIIAAPGAIYWLGPEGAAIVNSASLIMWKHRLWRYGKQSAGIDLSPIPMFTRSGDS